MKSSLTLEHQICFQLYTASKELTRLYRPILEPLKLTYSQYLVMLVLWEEDHIDLKQLGERLTLDSGTLSPLIKRLTQLGYVEKIRATDDERRVLVSLTASGSALREQAEDVPVKVSGMLNIDEATYFAYMEMLIDIKSRLREFGERQG
ncbi:MULTISPECIES: MarR family winged helix-turn-helix transcriptional regulator [Exiguobacterium]|uniref:MarR family winged helix-turn-helix transcriptional regulator n=1 Tax=Exiguobacterium TaxID=33986 RepID=UPI000877A109|nr:MULTISPECIES: MarR family transcriptional regulator [Exiguobacterium]OGX78360.1 MarR family transcriptional regulator [Exiguobacterium sp. SH31]TCI37656.1 MarR family transcriptional regulator [Exiguobacterium sp. SH4S7]TCI45990.1 MarR family transcriptional regulator [Exiguobacterium sp. SH5S32]TCI51747.1 MarR family transcriptional regulator [Exiguobacterium sp. SH1S4]TCI53795.1 MarR family transcriptional regulator [Exiguobacterium sp. SH1S21]